MSRVYLFLVAALVHCSTASSIPLKNIRVRDPTLVVTRSEKPHDLAETAAGGFAWTLQETRHPMREAVGIERLGCLNDVLLFYGSKITHRSDPLERHGRELKLLALIGDNVDLNIGNLWDNRPRFSLPTPDLAIGLEGLFSSLARTTLTALASQLTDGLLGPAPSSAFSAPVPQATGIQNQYQLQYTRGPWNVQSGLQIGLQRQNDASETFFLDQSTGDYENPQAVFQQASDVYYGQAFSEGYNQGFTQGTQSPIMGIPTGSLPPLTSESPTGFNEGAVSGFTRGLQDGYYAGFQSAQTTQSSALAFQSSYPGGATNSRSATGLPRALPHVAPNGPLPQDLFQAQQEAMVAYTEKLETRIRDLEQRTNEQEFPRSGDPIQNETVDEELLEEQRSKRSSRTAQPPSTTLDESSSTANATQTMSKRREIEDAKNEIFGLSYWTALFVISGIALCRRTRHPRAVSAAVGTAFVVVLFGFLCCGLWIRRARSQARSSPCSAMASAMRDL